MYLQNNMIQVYFHKYIYCLWFSKFCWSGLPWNFPESRGKISTVEGVHTPSSYTEYNWIFFYFFCRREANLNTACQLKTNNFHKLDTEHAGVLNRILHCYIDGMVSLWFFFLLLFWRLRNVNERFSCLDIVLHPRITKNMLL